MTTPTLPTNRAELDKRLLLRPLRNDADLRRAAKFLDRLVMLTHPTKAQAEYMEVLTLLVQAYEKGKSKLAQARLQPLDMLKFLLDENDMSASDLGRLLGNRPLGSAILRGERQLSKTHIQKLCGRFKVQADLFLPPAPQRTATSSQLNGSTYTLRVAATPPLSSTAHTVHRRPS